MLYLPILPWVGCWHGGWPEICHVWRSHPIASQCPAPLLPTTPTPTPTTTQLWSHLLHKQQPHCLLCFNAWQIPPPWSIGCHMGPSDVYKSVGRTLVHAVSFTLHCPPAKGLTQRVAQTLLPAMAEDCPRGKPDFSLLSKSLHSGTRPPWIHSVMA